MDDRTRAEALEEAAKEIYEAMRWAIRHRENGQPPEWVERGNSHAQVEARRTVERIRSLIQKEESK